MRSFVLKSSYIYNVFGITDARYAYS